MAMTRWEVASLATETTMIGLSEEFVRDFLREECAKAGGQAAWAELHRVSASYVNDVLHGRRDPGDSICTPGWCGAFWYLTDDGKTLARALIGAREAA